MRSFCRCCIIAPGRALPSGWWIAVALLFGAAFWVGLGLWLAEVLR